MAGATACCGHGGLGFPVRTVSRPSIILFLSLKNWNVNKFQAVPCGSILPVVFFLESFSNNIIMNRVRQNSESCSRLINPLLPSRAL